MQLVQIKHDLKASLQTDNYYAEVEFFRLLDANIPHEEKITLLKAQLSKITDTINNQRLVEAFLPEQKPAETNSQTGVENSEA